MGYAGRQNIYEAVIRRMVEEAVERQEQEFAQAHSLDSEEALLDCLRQTASRLGHTPWPGEFAGGGYIERRFGSWEEALHRAQLPRPSVPERPSEFARFQEERARQSDIYRQQKAEKKQRARQRQGQQTKKKTSV